MDPLEQARRGVLSARRITKSANPIVWTVEAVALGLDLTGNLIASKN